MSSLIISVRLTGFSKFLSVLIQIKGFFLASVVVSATNNQQCTDCNRLTLWCMCLECSLFNCIVLWIDESVMMSVA